MKNIILRGNEYKRLATEKIVDQKAIFYSQNEEILVYEEKNGKRMMHLPKIDAGDKNKCNLFLTSLIGSSFSLEDMNLILRLEEYYPKFETINNKLKRKYIDRIRDYYSYCVDFDLLGELQPIVHYDDMIYPRVVPIDEAIERLFSYNENSRTGYALEEFQKVKKR